VGEKAGGEVKLSQGFVNGDQFSPAVTTLSNGNIAVAFVDLRGGDNDIYVQIWSPTLTFIRQDNINTGALQTVDPSITALAGGAYAISYTQGTGADTDIIGQLVSGAGGVGGPVRHFQRYR